MLTKEEIASVIRSHCFVYIQSVEGKTIATQDIDHIEIQGIEEAAMALAKMQTE
jgi:hypothetical protein